MPDDEATKPGFPFTPSEQRHLENLRAKINNGQISESRIRPDEKEKRLNEEKNSLGQLFQSHGLPRANIKNQDKNSNHRDSTIEEIPKQRKATVTKEKYQSESPELQAKTAREMVSLFTIKGVEKLAEDRYAKRLERASDLDPDPLLIEYRRQLQTDEDPLIISAEIYENSIRLVVHYDYQYLSQKDNTLKSFDGTFKSNQNGEFSIVERVKNYDTGKVTHETYDFNLPDQTIKKEAWEAVERVQGLLAFYLEEN